MKPRPALTTSGLPGAAAVTPPDAPRRPADVVIAVILGVAAIVSPLFLGGSSAVARFALEATLAVVIVVWACDRRRSTGALILPLGIACLVWLQLIPLPDSLLVWMAPISGGAWKVAQEGIPGAWGRISIDPAATAAGARRLLLGVGSFLVVRDIAANAGIRRGLAAAVAFSAALIWGLGLAFPCDTMDDLLLGLVDLKGPIDDYVSPVLAPVETAGCGIVTTVTVGQWRYLVAEGHIGDGFGPFIGSNQFAGALCLTLPLLLSLWLTITRAGLPAWIGVAGTVAIGAAATWTTGFRAGSRAGGVAVALACIAFLLLTAENRRWRWTLVGITLVTVISLAVLVAAAFGLIPGFKTLLPEDWQPLLGRLLADSRSMGIWVGLRMVRASPVAGTGLDSYGEVFPRFQPGNGTIFYAHNDYVQWIAETGLIGGLLATWCAIVFVRRGVTGFRSQQGLERIWAAGAAAGVIGFAMHEFFEWNLHLPAIGLMALVVAGLAVPTVPITASITGRTTGFAGLRIPTALVLVTAVTAAVGYLARDMATEQAAVQLRKVLAADRLALLKPKQHSPPPVAAMKMAIAAGTAATGWDSANADLPLLLGQLNLHLAARAFLSVDREEFESAAREWLEKARRRRAICFGMPELMAPVSKRPVLSNSPRPIGH